MKKDWFLNFDELVYTFAFAKLWKKNLCKILFNFSTIMLNVLAIYRSGYPGLYWVGPASGHFMKVVNPPPDNESSYDKFSYFTCHHIEGFLKGRIEFCKQRCWSVTCSPWRGNSHGYFWEKTLDFISATETIWE